MLATNYPENSGRLSADVLDHEWFFLNGFPNERASKMWISPVGPGLLRWLPRRKTRIGYLVSVSVDFEASFQERSNKGTFWFSIFQHLSKVFYDQQVFKPTIFHDFSDHQKWFFLWTWCAMQQATPRLCPRTSTNPIACTSRS